MIWSRREWLLATTVALTGCSSRQAVTGCASLAGRTIRWIVPFGDGGTHEIYSRVLEPLYERSLGAEIIIVIEPGNGGIVGATKLRDASPDGRTLGILSAPGLFGAAVAGEERSPNPARDFAVIGRLARSRPAISVAASSRFRSVEDLIEYQKTRPLVCAFSGLGSNSLLVFSVCEALLGFRLDYISGLSGSRDSLLALLRGDTDLVAFNFDTVQEAVAQGDVRMLLQIADGPISDDPSLSNTPWLGGPKGWAARRALELARDPSQAIAQAQALIDLTGAGIVVAAPKALPADLLACMRARLFEAASSSAFRAGAHAAMRTVDVATGEQARKDLLAAEEHVARFAPIVRAAFDRARK
jgi:tripartite-type tricarboxylate transporter receptor subunit TctC